MLARRPYHAPRREARAKLTRRRLLESAEAEFRTRGYPGATIPAIAARAGVSVPWVEREFRTKAALFKTVLDIAIAGDDEPVAVLDRPWAREVESTADPTAFIELVCAKIAETSARASGLVLAALEGAAADPALRPLARQLKAQRLVTATWIVERIAERSRLRVTRERAVDTTWLLMDPAVFCRLTADRQWSRPAFEGWLRECLVRLLLP